MTEGQPGAWPPPARGNDLAALLARVARGDQAAFATVYDRAAAQVFGLVSRVVRDPAQSEEVTQEVMLDVWRTASRFDPRRGSAMVWLPLRPVTTWWPKRWKAASKPSASAGAWIPSPSCSANRSPWPTTAATPTGRLRACSGS